MMDTADVRAPAAVASAEAGPDTAAMRMLRAGVGPRAAEVLDLAARGATTIQIGAALGISPETVHNHLTLLMDRFGVQNRTALACLYHGGRPIAPEVPAPRAFWRRIARED